jgi:hypothetical protein
MKLVTGVDGQNARKVASAITRIGRVPTVPEAIEVAAKFQFGAYQQPEHRANPIRFASLVIQTPDRDFYPAWPDEVLGGLYREKFSDPLFNPRWAEGTAAHTEVVRL